MKGDFTIAVLERLAEAAMEMGDLTLAVLEAGYGASSGRILQAKEQIEMRRVRKRHEREQYDRIRKRCYNILAWLEQDGFIERKEKKFFTTFQGSRYLKKLLERKKKALPPPQYVITKSVTTIIVAFDIPEKERRKREWVRQALRRIGCMMLQKSLWVGRVKVPREFLDDLAKLGLIEAVEIFEIGKKGSLRQILPDS
ncbi:MAG: CRISPR-associated endonuclease Cas2 [Candidatus Liptonbacteria bacterium]|nr:CRISPR-associated endonuclease Cas2 [Candidatus Liptonbacteria bacterium]